MRVNGSLSFVDGDGNTQKVGGLSQSFRGLYLRTHPDADVASSKIMLVHADEIVFDDGTRVTEGLDRLVADVTASGAGGLDTGSEAASVWYEIYAIRKSSDGTLNLLLHRSKDYYLDQQQTTNATYEDLRRADGTFERLAQGVQVATAGVMPFVDLQMHRAGSPTGRVWVTIESDNSGSPSGTVIATSDKFDVALFGTSAQWVRFVFRTPPTLSTATTYHIVLRGDYTSSDANLLRWHRNNANSYANGTGKRYNGSSWTDLSADWTFKLYVTRNSTSVTMPTGYDQKCLVGYVCNDSSSDFRQFQAHDREVRYQMYAIPVSGVTATTQTQLDLSNMLPPVPVFVTNVEARLATSTGYLSFGGGLSNSVAGNYQFFYQFTADYSVDIGTLVPIENQVAYFKVSAGTGYLYLIGWRW